MGLRACKFDMHCVVVCARACMHARCVCVCMCVLTSACVWVHACAYACLCMSTVTVFESLGNCMR